MTTQAYAVLSLVVACLSVVVAIAAVIATFKAPVIALHLQKKQDEDKERTNRKMWIYRTLMANRATRINPNFVQALNSIDMEFTAEDEKEVRDAWRELLDHYNDWAKMGDEVANVRKATDLLSELLVKMGNSLGYKFARLDVKKAFYYPEGLSTVEQEQHALRRAALNLLSGQGAKLPVAIFEQKFQEIAVEPLRGDGKND